VMNPPAHRSFHLTHCSVRLHIGGTI
jgi:hypothetical protein